MKLPTQKRRELHSCSRQDMHCRPTGVPVAPPNALPYSPSARRSCAGAAVTAAGFLAVCQLALTGAWLCLRLVASLRGRERRWALGGPGGGLPPARVTTLACWSERYPSSDATCFLLLAALLLEAVVYFSLCHAHDMLIERARWSFQQSIFDCEMV